jgi:chromatin segregation and condensation protein Rec8/ScpA/Scc1 (kleisin family)
MDDVRIPNSATYTPVALMDIAMLAPIASRLLLNATLPGRVLQAVALGAYVGSAARDWFERLGVRRIEFLQEFGADVKHLRAMPREARELEVRILVERANDVYIERRIPRAELAVEVDRHLTNYIASVTGQRVETSTEIRSYSIVQVVLPFALGACDILSGDVAILKDTGVFEPHVITHEFAHRKGYWKELDAQALSYLALTSSGEPVLLQSALCERLLRQLVVLADAEPDRYREAVEASNLRPELRREFLAMRPVLGKLEGSLERALKTIYDERMKITGQNGLADYDEGFTNFLYSFETNEGARRRPPRAGIVHLTPGE